jgi:hypothetical protein
MMSARDAGRLPSFLYCDCCRGLLIVLARNRLVRYQSSSAGVAAYIRYDIDLRLILLLFILGKSNDYN